MWNAGLNEAQTGIKIAVRNINNLGYRDDNSLMVESEEELKSLLMKVKEEGEKSYLKLNIQKPKIMASGPITSWQIDGETIETVSDFIFLGSKITADGNCSLKNKRHLFQSAALNMPANLENSAVATGLEKVSFHSNPKERQWQRMLKHNCTHLTC